jgi:hypothetical protein
VISFRYPGCLLPLLRYRPSYCIKVGPPELTSHFACNVSEVALQILRLDDPQVHSRICYYAVETANDYGFKSSRLDSSNHIGSPADLGSRIDRLWRGPQPQTVACKPRLDTVTALYVPRPGVNESKPPFPHCDVMLHKTTAVIGHHITSDMRPGG